MQVEKQVLKLALAALLLAGCGKDNEGNAGKDTTAPVVTIKSPVANTLVGAGQTISVNATATDNVKLTELHIHITNKTTGALLRDTHSYPGAASGVVQDAFAAQAATVYIVKIIAFDAAQNLSTAEVEVAVQ